MRGDIELSDAEEAQADSPPTGAGRKLISLRDDASNQAPETVEAVLYAAAVAFSNHPIPLVIGRIGETLVKTLRASRGAGDGSKVP